MHAALATVPAVTDAITLPLVLTVALAAVALGGIAVYVRHARRAGRLTSLTAAASGVCAAGVLASALLLTVAFGSAPAAVADSPAAHIGSSVQSPAGGLSGYQLPTE